MLEKEFNVYGKIVINVEMDIMATSEEEAIQKAIEEFKNTYRLDVQGNYHDIDKVEYKNLEAIEYE
jgi:hypothetical protein